MTRVGGFGFLLDEDDPIWRRCSKVGRFGVGTLEVSSDARSEEVAPLLSVKNLETVVLSICCDKGVLKYPIRQRSDKASGWFS